MPLRFAIFGNPVAHSKSPFIHGEFARQAGIDLVYDLILAPLEGFAASVAEFRTAGGAGANVTLPFKQEAFQLADSVSPRAREAEAVNTLVFRADGVDGDNTDGIGLVRDIEHNCAYALHGRRVLLLGAGGAARGVVGPLLATGLSQLVIANRTLSKAAAIASLFAASGKVSALQLSALPGHQFDLVINATSASLAADLPPVPPSAFAAGALAYDMVYGKGLTPFLELARQAGARTTDGAGMLVEQAAESFRIWHGVRPDTRLVLDQLRGG